MTTISASHERLRRLRASAVERGCEATFDHSFAGGMLAFYDLHDSLSWPVRKLLLSRLAKAERRIERRFEQRQ